MASNVPVSHQGSLHYVPAGLAAFEYAPQAGKTPDNLLLWIPGLMDTWGTVEYPAVLASRLPSNWSLATLSLSSSGRQWGVASLDTDVADIAKIVSYFRSIGRTGKIALMGYSTGCQDTIHYLVSPGSRPPVDAAILQAPVSDREIFRPTLGEEAFSASIATAERMVKEGKGEDCLPVSVVDKLFGPVPVSARRWLSLAAVEGQDDYFSSDLSDTTLQNTFGRITKGTHLLLLSGADDQYVPKTIDIPSLLKRWVATAKQAGVVVDDISLQQVPGATHNSNGRPEAIKQLIDRVLNFLPSVDGTRAS